MEKIIIGKAYAPEAVEVKKSADKNTNDIIIGTKGDFRRRDSLLAYIKKNKSFLTKKNLLGEDEQGNTTLILECGRGKNLTKTLFVIETEKDAATRKRNQFRESIV